VPRWENGPQAHSKVSNINFDIRKKIVEWGLYKYPIKIYQERHSSFPLWA
jgi:hypothetical protein